MAKKTGRPRIKFDEKDWRHIIQMCQIHCTKEEISSVLLTSEDTLERRIKDKYKISFAVFYKKHNQEGKQSLRRAMFRNATERNNATMQIWLSKQHLGMRDNVTHQLESKDKKLNIFFGGAKDGEKTEVETGDDKAGAG